MQTSGAGVRPTLAGAVQNMGRAKLAQAIATLKLLLHRQPSSRLGDDALLLMAEATAEANRRDVVQPEDLPITKGLQQSIHEFEKRFISKVLGCCDGSTKPGKASAND